jgi:hypothetical protein
MSDQLWALLSKVVFGGSIFLVLYIVYREYTLNRIKAENAEIALGEKENEDLVSAESDTDLIGSASSSSPTKPTGALPGSPIANGNAKKPSN